MTSDTRVSLKDLSAEALLELGGLKTQCSAQIKCTEHSHIVPCEICLLEDRVGSFCDACGKSIDTPPVPGERVCASIEQFKSTGRVAFEEEAVAALAERESRRPRTKEKELPAESPWPAGDDVPAPHAPGSSPSVETKHERMESTAGLTDSADRKVWDDFKRKHLGDYYVPARRRPRSTTPVSTETETVVDLREGARDRTSVPAGDGRVDTETPAPVEKRPRRPRERSPAKSTEVSTPVYEAPTAPRPSDRRNSNNDLIAKVSIWASLIATIVGAYVMFHSPWMDGGTRSNWYALAFGALTLLIWFFGVYTLFGRAPAHGTMSWWSPAVWAFFAAPWPALGAHMLCKTIAPGQGLVSSAFFLIIGLAVAAILIYQLVSVGTRLTMDAPWPVPMDDESDTADEWLWAKILATVFLNVSLWDFGSAMWRHTQAPPQATAPTLSVQLDRLVSAVNAPQRPASLRSGPEMDRITKALAEIDAQKKPAPGNIEKARKLQTEAMKLTAKGDWANAYPLLKLAHEAAPGADSIGVMLGLTESMIGKEFDARRHLAEALTINPRNSAGWRTLGSLEIRDGKGSEAAVARASQYYVASWWFAKDRKRLQQLLDREAAGNPAIANAVKRMRKKLSS